MQVRKIIAAGLIIAEIMLLFSSSAQAQNRKLSVECNAALQDAKNKIQKNRKVKIVKTIKLDISQHYRSYPSNRLFSHIFGLTGAATGSILSSEKFLTTIAKDIINKCPSISMVEFNEYETDHVESYGLLENNDVGLFKCLDMDDLRARTKLHWGYVVCL
jgi:hypothetical protein